jgi:hypothetical protein
MRKRLYSIALFTVKLDPAQELTSVREYGFSAMSVGDSSMSVHHFHMEYQMVADSELASSEVEVLELALERAKELWPESDGYVAHRAYWSEIPDEQILLAAAALEGGMLMGEDVEEREM